MVWKQDLARLRQTLKDSGEVLGKKASPPKVPIPKAPPSASIEEEDDIFLRAMGRRPSPHPVSRTEPVLEPLPQAQAQAQAEAGTVASPGLAPGKKPTSMAEPPPLPLVENFQEAMASLKGLKRVGTPDLASLPPKASGSTPGGGHPSVPTASAPAPHSVSGRTSDTVSAAIASAPPPEAPEPRPDHAAPEAPPVSLVAPSHASVRVPAPLGAESMVPRTEGPRQIQLAAGMAIEVDGHLDLRGHCRADVLERLEERVQDGRFLGWRTLHVQLGSSPEAKEALFDFLGAEGARWIARYAQAPIPMGGAQAWILYFVQQ